MAARISGIKCSRLDSRDGLVDRLLVLLLTAKRAGGSG